MEIFMSSSAANFNNEDFGQARVTQLRSMLDPPDAGWEDDRPKLLVASVDWLNADAAFRHWVDAIGRLAADTWGNSTGSGGEQLAYIELLRGRAADAVFKIVSSGFFSFEDKNKGSRPSNAKAGMTWYRKERENQRLLANQALESAEKLLRFAYEDYRDRIPYMKECVSVWKAHYQQAIKGR
jgi:hypothetical protein